MGALGYDLRTLNLGIDEAELGKGPPLEVYLVRKQKPEREQRKERPHGAISNTERAGDDNVADIEADTSDAHVVASNDEGEEEDNEEDEVKEHQAAAARLFESLSLGDGKGGNEHDEGVQAGDTICSVDLTATASLASDNRPGDSSARAVSHVDNDVVGDLETCDAELNCIA